jgi:FtsZ-binding cell division protein ZapB
MEVTFPQFIVGTAAFLAVYFFRELNANVKEAVGSVKELNTKIAVVIERTETHSHEIVILREKQDNLQNDVAQIKAHIIIKES